MRKSRLFEDELRTLKLPSVIATYTQYNNGNKILLHDQNNSVPEKHFKYITTPIIL